MPMCADTFVSASRAAFITPGPQSELSNVEGSRWKLSIALVSSRPPLACHRPTATNLKEISGFCGAVCDLSPFDSVETTKGHQQLRVVNRQLWQHWLERHPARSMLGCDPPRRQCHQPLLQRGYACDRR